MVFLSSLVKYDHFPSFFFCVTLLCKNHPKNRENCTHFYNWPWKKAALIFPQCHFPKKGIHFILRNNPTLLGNFAPFFSLLLVRHIRRFWFRNSFCVKLSKLLVCFLAFCCVNFVPFFLSLRSFLNHFLAPIWLLQGLLSSKKVFISFETKSILGLFRPIHLSGFL